MKIVSVGKKGLRLLTAGMAASVTLLASGLEGATPKDERRRSGDMKTLMLPDGVEMEMIYVAPGTFMMGSPSGEDGRSNDETEHRVRLTKGYWLGKYEVTQRQWNSVMGENPSCFKSPNHPVENVSWEDCQEFIAKIDAATRRQFGGKARLPTEAEWEYACRAGTTTAYNWGNILNGDRANCDAIIYPYGMIGKGRWRMAPTDVGSYPPNAWGFYDMHGNVWEWCNDWYDNDYYSQSPMIDPQGPVSGWFRVLRGGSWHSLVRHCRSAFRNWPQPGLRIDDFGFRLCCSD